MLEICPRRLECPTHVFSLFRGSFPFSTIKQIKNQIGNIQSVLPFCFELTSHANKIWFVRKEKGFFFLFYK